MNKYDVTMSQLPKGVLMRLGAREFSGSDTYRDCLSILTFKVGKRMTWVEIKLMPSDTYTVTMLRLKPKTYERKELAKAEDVYCDSLGQVLLRMEKHLAS